MEAIAWGYGLVEGPRADARGGLYFSDVMRGGVFYRHPDGEIETVVEKRRAVGGIALHADGGIVISGRDVCHVRDGETRLLFERPAGALSFNDLFTDAQGRVVTGTMCFNPFERGATASPGSAFRIWGDNQAERLYGDVGLTNGIGFSPDGRQLYHSDTTAQHVIVHDVDPQGRLTNRRALPVRQPDGLAVDSEGGIWVASYDQGCVVRLTPDGREERRLEVPASQVTSVCFGHADPGEMYIATADNRDQPDRRGTIFRTRAPFPGLVPQPARI